MLGTTDLQELGAAIPSTRDHSQIATLESILIAIFSLVVFIYVFGVIVQTVRFIGAEVVPEEVFHDLI